MDRFFRVVMVKRAPQEEISLAADHGACKHMLPPRLRQRVEFAKVEGFSIKEPECSCLD
jgi:hypothetical protein